MGPSGVNSWVADRLNIPNTPPIKKLKNGNCLTWKVTSPPRHHAPRRFRHWPEAALLNADKKLYGRFWFRLMRCECWNQPVTLWGRSALSSLRGNTARSSCAGRFSAPNLRIGKRKAKLNLVVLDRTHPVVSAAPGGWVERLKSNPFSIVSNVTNDELFLAGPIDCRDSELLIDDWDGVLCPADKAHLSVCSFNAHEFKI